MLYSSSERDTSTKEGPLHKFLMYFYRIFNYIYGFLQNIKIYNEDGPWCPAFFGGFSCWKPTMVGVSHYQNCSNVVGGFDSGLIISRSCIENGTWQNNTTLTDLNSSLTNDEYLLVCTTEQDLEFRGFINNINIWGYSLSIPALLVALVILKSCKQLQCTRIRIHMHLFTSLTINYSCWIVWYIVVIKYTIDTHEYKEWIRWLHVISTYALIASYSWMFCEGLHLYVVLSKVFVSKELSMRTLTAVGWGMPLLVVLLYAIVSYFFGPIDRCWEDTNDISYWVISIPVGLTLSASTFFFFAILRIIITKGHANSTSRAASMLIPLCGVYTIMFAFRPLKTSQYEPFFRVIAALLTSTQGLYLTFVICFNKTKILDFIKAYLFRRLKTTDIQLQLQGEATHFTSVIMKIGHFKTKCGLLEIWYLKKLSLSLCERSASAFVR